MISPISRWHNVESPVVEAETSLVDVKRLNLSSQIQPQLFLDLDITSNLELGKPARLLNQI